MKRIVLILYTSFATCGMLHAQTFAEWFQQKKTQLSYLVNQIAAYKICADYLEKGYQIAGDGLNSIEKWKRGEFDLHDLFFASLKSVNSSIAAYSKLPGILSLGAAIKNECKKILQLENLSDAEMDYLRSVCNDMVKDCNSQLNELSDLLTNDVFEMKDDERIERIDRIYDDMKDKCVFIQSFSGEAKIFSMQKILNP